MEYNGYAAEIEFDDGDQIYHGRVSNIDDVITLEGYTESELHQAFIDSVEDYLEFCQSENKLPSQPKSQSTILR